MKVHTAVVSTANTSEERHAVFRRAIAPSHDLTASTRRRGAIDGCNGPRRVFASVVRDIQANHGRPPTRRRALDDHNLRDLPVLSEVLVRTQSWYELRGY